ncbi:MAG: hypothetical protein HW420_1433 [Candidatus Nitrosotenuis sp.]|nr:hypothetical protein [Candidatus Nitrosotenuis sp.]
MKQKTKLGLVFDFSLLVMVIVYFIGFLSFHPQSLFLKESPFHIPHEYEIYFEVLLWAIFGLLAVDLYFKYKKLDNWKLFLKKHWHDIIMLGLIPFLTAFKIAKISVSMVKTLKASKAGFKILYKAKKASKHFKS